MSWLRRKPKPRKFDMGEFMLLMKVIDKELRELRWKYSDDPRMKQVSDGLFDLVRLGIHLCTSEQMDYVNSNDKRHKQFEAEYQAFQKAYNL